MNLENQNILILSNEPWGEIWYSKHNYANELSKKNKVFFLNPPNAFSIWKIFNLKIEEKIIHPNLSVIEYSNRLPVSLFNFWKLNDFLVLNRLNKYFKVKKIKDLLFWTFDPIRLGFPEILEPKKVIVHAVDAYLFSYPSEILLAKKADQILCVSEKIADSYKNYNTNVHIIPHAIPDDEFLPVHQNRNSPLTGVFIGKMDLRMDFEFNLEIFKSFPQIQFKIIGIVNDAFLKRLQKEKLGNVTLLPPIKSNEIRNYVRSADFCFVFKNIVYGNNISSHKLLQYLAQGKAIFGTDFSDMSPELKKTLHLSNTISEIKDALSTFSENDEYMERTHTRINYAKQFTFSKTIASIEAILKLESQSTSYLYYSHPSPKTKFLNFFRKRLANPFLDKGLSSLMRKNVFLRSLLNKIIPPEYLYNNPSWRPYDVNGIKMKLNISNLVDHCVYFSDDQKALNAFLKHLKSTDVVIDIGANIGYTTLLFSKVCGEGEVISIEPSKELFETIENHIKLNNLNNITPLNVAVGEKEKKAKLYSVSENNSGMNRIFENDTISFNSEIITIKTLDELVLEQNITTVNAIKIDVEGYEYKVLKGAYNTLKAKHPILFIEIDENNLKEQHCTPAEIFQFLFDLNYSVFEAETMRKIELSNNYSGVHFDVICLLKNH